MLVSWGRDGVDLEREPGTLKEAFVVGICNSTHTRMLTHVQGCMHSHTYAHAHMCTCSHTHALAPMHYVHVYTDPHMPTQAHMITHIASFAFVCLILVCWQLSLPLLSNVPFSAAALPAAGEMDVIASSATARPIQKSLAVDFFLLCFLFIIYIVLLLPSSRPPLGRIRGLLSSHRLIGHLSLSVHHLVRPRSLRPGGGFGEGSGLRTEPWYLLSRQLASPSLLPTKGS